MSIDDIVTEIQSMVAKVKSCVVTGEESRIQRATGAKGKTYPNGMGNADRFPAPWDRNWETRLAEREEKRVLFKAELLAQKEWGEEEEG